MYILTCPKCGKMFKCTKQGEHFITDFGDIITDICICCGRHIKPHIIHTEDWVANLVFTIKG